MIDQQMLQLHDRATKGESLSAVEQAALQNWYAEQDRAESVLLSQREVNLDSAVWREQLKTALERISQTAAENEKLAAQNEILRGENEKLRDAVENRLWKKTV